MRLLFYLRDRHIDADRCPSQTRDLEGQALQLHDSFYRVLTGTCARKCLEADHVTDLLPTANVTPARVRMVTDYITS